jgi:hypothetical protein
VTSRAKGQSALTTSCGSVRSRELLGDGRCRATGADPPRRSSGWLARKTRRIREIMPNQ